VTSSIIKSKVYIEIVRKLRSIIDEDGLRPGDKIPSERELSERLHVGRSSVREALRALELLGLIETKIGEGTYLRNARNNQLVELLSTFILQDEKAKHDVQVTKHLIEMDCLRLIIQRNNEKQLLHFKKWAETEDFSDDEFFIKLVELADNQLFYRIWIILCDYYCSLNFMNEQATKEDYAAVVNALIAKDEQRTWDAFRQLRRIVE
jgi:DNA-binding FadR family transcriptional regulator